MAQLRTDVSQPDRKEYAPSNDTEDRTFNADSSSTAELADVLATLIRDLADLGIVDVS